MYFGFYDTPTLDRSYDADLKDIVNLIMFNQSAEIKYLLNLARKFDADSKK